MGRIVYAAATSHVAAIVKNPDADPPRAARLDAAWRRMDAEIEAARLDAVVIVATDHYETFGLENYPAFCLGLNEEFDGWGEFGSARIQVEGAPEAAGVLLAGLTGAGFDISRSHTMRLDHSFMTPLVRLPAMAATKVIPLFVNCNTPPLPGWRRCYDLGTALAAAAQALPEDARLGVLASGGISHWVGVPRFGDINEDFDREYLRLLADARYEEVFGWTDEWVDEHAGNGALELRTWMVAAGASAGAAADVFAYEPMYPWVTGIGISRFGGAVEAVHR
jgi:aromatic ring-opening dioxygenase catalytic subunit (LigB family)